MKVLSALALAASSALIVGCDTEYKGRMLIPAPIMTQGQKAPYLMPAGDYSLRILFKSKKEVHLLLKASKKKEERIRLKGNTELPFPAQGGDLFLSAAQINQPFNVVARVDYSRSETPERFRIDSCSVSREVRVCKLQADNTEVCSRETRALSGRQEVRFYTVSESRILTGELESPTDGATLAQLSASNHEGWDVITGRSPCVLDPHQRGLVEPSHSGNIVLGF